MTVSLEFIARRLDDMQTLLLALNDNAGAANRRLERIELQLGELINDGRRAEHRLQAVELRLGELAVRIGALETS
jgi:hypothetical protein